MKNPKSSKLPFLQNLSDGTTMSRVRKDLQRNFFKRFLLKKEFIPQFFVPASPILFPLDSLRVRRHPIHSSENRTAMSVRTGGIKPSDPKKPSDLTRAKYYRKFLLEICVESSSEYHVDFFLGFVSTTSYEFGHD